jgi:hypothetical protein
MTSASSGRHGIKTQLRRSGIFIARPGYVAELIKMPLLRSYYRFPAVTPLTGFTGPRYAN